MRAGKIPGFGSFPSTPNTIVGINTALRLLNTLPNGHPQQALFCIEHTGIDKADLLAFANKLRFPSWVASSLQIKKAGGRQRGKTDSTDAQPVRRCGIAEQA